MPDIGIFAYLLDLELDLLTMAGLLIVTLVTIVGTKIFLEKDPVKNEETSIVPTKLIIGMVVNREVNLSREERNQRVAISGLLFATTLFIVSSIIVMNSYDFPSLFYILAGLISGLLGYWVKADWYKGYFFGSLVGMPGVIWISALSPLGFGISALWLFFFSVGILISLGLKVAIKKAMKK